MTSLTDCGTGGGPEERQFCELMKKLEKEKDLVDVKFYAGETSESTPETFFREANQILTMFADGDLEESSFNDSTHS